MLGSLTRYIILFFIITLSLSGSAQTVVDSLKSKLAESDNLRDSIILLYNLYDNAPFSLQSQTLEDLYKLSMRHGDYKTVTQVLKQSSNHYGTNDSMQQVLIARAKRLPDSPEKQGTLVYLKVKAASNLARSLTKEQREAKLREYLGRHTKVEKYDTYERIEYLFQLCTYLSMSTEGELLTNYLQELQTLIDTLPTDDLALKYLFYTQAATGFLSNGMIPEAVEANKNLLGIIEKLENHNAANGRAPRNYDNTAFMCYSRLLCCHDALTQDEIEEFYSKINSLIDRNAALQSIPGVRNKPTIYYLMAKKSYADDIPLIRKQLNDRSNTGEEKLYLVEALVKATEADGDKENMLMALEMSNDVLKERIKHKAKESYKELQMIYEVNDLKQTNDELMLTNQQREIKRHKQQLASAIIILIILAALLVVVFLLYRRSMQLTSNLTKANAMITNERDTLRRTQDDLIEARDKVKKANLIKADFINNMSHEIRTPLESIVEYSGLIVDCTDTDRREYVRRFADVIALNSDLLLTLVNEVLDLPSLENAKVSVHKEKSSVQEICENVINKVRSGIVKPGISLIFANEGQNDTIIMTDPHRVEQVLLNLLTNAANFTGEGSITLTYALSAKRDKVVFSVTDTGIGIPADKEDIIFSRFGKLSSDTKGNGLGLYLSRLLAKMLGGSLTLDKDYHKGAKFIFTIPLS